MSYTSIEQLRPYLQSGPSTGEPVTDCPVRLSGINTTRFCTGAIVSGTVRVKSLQSSELTRTRLQLTEGSNQICSSPVDPATVLIASDSSLGRIYNENFDYVLAASVGSLTLKEGGALTPGMNIVAWYQPYRVYSEGIDYIINLAAGEIRRIASGYIHDGETVLIDYQSTVHDLNDEILTAAVIEANGIIERLIDPAQEYGADPALAAAATALALATVARIAAARELSGARGDDRVAQTWLTLADSQASRAEKLISTFRPPAQSPASPRRI